jgi:hypothetical protein
VPAGFELLDVFSTSFMQGIMPGLHSTYATYSCQGENKWSRNASRHLGMHEDFPFLRSGKKCPSVKKGGIRGRRKWVMDYEIACGGPMSPEIRESHAGQRLAEEGG